MLAKSGSAKPGRRINVALERSAGFCFLTATKSLVPTRYGAYTAFTADFVWLLASHFRRGFAFEQTSTCKGPF